MNTTTNTANDIVERMSKSGAHFGLAKARRHPSAKELIFASKHKVDLFDLEKTAVFLDAAKDVARKLGIERKTLLFVGGKPESQRTVKSTAIRAGTPYCVGRWIGGTISNYAEIKKRIARYETLKKDKETGALSKYTKFERLTLDRELAKLESMYAGLTSLGDKLPDALFVVDPKREAIAVREAASKRIPVIALANSDCDMNAVQYPIPANDAAAKSIAFFVNEIAEAYEEGLRQKPAAQAPQTA